MSHIQKLAPQMNDYNERFHEDGSVRWMPYLMYFNPRNLNVPAFSTDSKGFRYSISGENKVSPANSAELKSVRILAGGSTTFGMGASSDAWTLPSRLNVHDSRNTAWLNFGGVGFSSTQELLLFTLYQQLLPKVEEVVILTGFNTLGLARQPAKYRGDHGAIYSCKQFFDAMYPKPEPDGFLKGLFKGPKSEDVTFTAEMPNLDGCTEKFDEKPTVEEQIEFASALTLEQLKIWKTLCSALGAKLTYVLQPLATWVRPRGSQEEELIFAELEHHWRFSESFGDILTQDVYQRYSSALSSGASALGVNFVDLNPIMANLLSPDQWVYVDRIHFNDHGHDLVAQQILHKTA